MDMDIGVKYGTVFVGTSYTMYLNTMLSRFAPGSGLQ